MGPMAPRGFFPEWMPGPGSVPWLDSAAPMAARVVQGIPVAAPAFWESVREAAGIGLAAAEAASWRVAGAGLAAERREGNGAGGEMGDSVDGRGCGGDGLVVGALGECCGVAGGDADAVQEGVVG